MNENEGNQPKCPGCGAPLPPDAPEGLCPRCVAANLAAGTDIKTGELGPEGTQVVKSAPAPAPSLEEIAKLFPQLEILEILGRGGMGAVYKARQPRLDRFVALKIIAAERKNDPQFAERFEREARTLARLHHPNIVAIHEFGETGGNFYLLMEFVDGLTLRQMLQKRKLSPEEALAIVPKICEALQYAHQQGVVHRDIKPENILLDKTGQVKIADFGIAKMMGEQPQAGLTQEKQVMGTPHYMAPEQVERPKTVDHRADIYSLGVVLYEMLTGELPLGKFAPPSRKVQVDVRLDEVVLHALEKEPDLRYQQAQQVKTDVEAIRSDPSRQPELLAAPVASASSGSDKRILPAFLLAFFFGIFGAHRFYVGKIVTGFLQLGAIFWCVFLIVACAKDFPPGQPTLGLLLGFSIAGCNIVAIIDWILLACRAFTDGEGKRITEWVGSQPSAPGGARPAISPGGAAASPVSTDSTNSKIVAAGVALMIAGLFKLSGALIGLLAVTGLRLPFFHHLHGLHFGFFPGLGGLPEMGVLLTQMVPGALILFGALQMVRLQSYAWSLAAAILSLISCSLISFPIGIWALVVLSQTDARQAFGQAQPKPLKLSGISWPFVAAIVVACLLATGLFSVGSYFWNASSGFSDDDSVSALAENTDDLSDTNALPLESDQTNQPTGASASLNSTGNIRHSGASANFTTSFAVAPGGKLTMDVDRGSVHISGSDRDTVEVRVTRRVTHASASKAAALIKEHRIELRQTGNDVSITAHSPPSLGIKSFFEIFSRPNLDVRYEIAVPRKYAIDSKTSGGNVEIKQIQDTVKAETMGGTVDLADIDGAADAKTMGGNVTASKCTADLRAHTSGGSINIEDFSGPCIHADTSGGNVTADFAVAPSSDSELKTMGGNVTASLPASAAFTLDAETMGGGVNTELPVLTEGKHHTSHLQGTVNGGGPTLRLHTMGGNIDVDKR
ncbi:MAG TPA: protein kinase [Verrucomicrobiae bacterium]|nr:protein kinase [Verrucomicrobiae bacterium]